MRTKSEVQFEKLLHDAYKDFSQWEFDQGLDPTAFLAVRAKLLARFIQAHEHKYAGLAFLKDSGTCEKYFGKLLKKLEEMPSDEDNMVLYRAAVDAYHEFSQGYKVAVSEKAAANAFLAYLENTNSDIELTKKEARSVVGSVEEPRRIRGALQKSIAILAASVLALGLFTLPKDMERDNKGAPKGNKEPPAGKFQKQFNLLGDRGLSR